MKSARIHRTKLSKSLSCVWFHKAKELILSAEVLLEANDPYIHTFVFRTAYTLYGVGLENIGKGLLVNAGEDIDFCHNLLDIFQNELKYDLSPEMVKSLLFLEESIVDGKYPSAKDEGSAKKWDDNGSESCIYPKKILERISELSPIEIGGNNLYNYIFFYRDDFQAVSECHNHSSK